MGILIARADCMRIIVLLCKRLGRPKDVSYGVWKGLRSVGQVLW